LIVVLTTFIEWTSIIVDCIGCKHVQKGLVGLLVGQVRKPLILH
jgi:hypothetical protein